MTGSALVARRAVAAGPAARWLEELRRAVAGLSGGGPAPTSCGGTLPTRRYFHPEATYKGTRIPLAWHRLGTFPADVYGSLPAAAYGMATGTYVNPDVRAAKQIKAEDLDELAASQEIAEYVEVIRQDVHLKLHPYCDIELRPYSLNLYGPGDHFRPHVDTLLDPGPGLGPMLGTVLLVMPNECQGGELVVDGTSYAPDEERVSWVAFYGDVQHEVLQVRQGIRIALAYAMFSKMGSGRRSGTAPSGAGQSFHTFHEAALAAALRGALEDPAFFPDGASFLLACKHKYGNRALYGAATPERGELFGAEPLEAKVLQEVLKGRDAAVASVATALGCSVYIRPFYVRVWEKTPKFHRDPVRRYLTRMPRDPEIEGDDSRELNDHLWRIANMGMDDLASSLERNLALEEVADPRGGQLEIFEEEWFEDEEVHLGNEGTSYDMYASALMQLQLPHRDFAGRIVSSANEGAAGA